MSSYDETRSRLSSANSARSVTIPGQKSGSAGGERVFDSDVDIYKRNNALLNFIRDEQRAEAAYQTGQMREKQDYANKVQSGADAIAKSQRDYHDGREQMFYNRNRVQAPQQQSGGREFTDLDWYKMNMQRNQQNGVGDMSFGGGDWIPSTYQNQANPYQPRATELNNRETPTNYLRQMVSRGTRG